MTSPNDTKANSKSFRIKGVKLVSKLSGIVVLTTT